MAKLISSMKSWLPYILLGVITMLILILGASIVQYTHRLSKHVETYADLSSVSFRSQVRSEAETTTKILNVTSSSSTKYLQRVLSSALNLPKLSFSDIEDNVAPYLFQVLSITPHLTQISFIGFNGLFFSYYKDGSQIFALYSNYSSVDHTFNASTYYLYTQMASRDNGKLYGNIQSFLSKSVFNYSSLFQKALNGKSGSHAFLGANWNNGQDLLFTNTSSINGNLGLVSLGFSVKEIMRYYTDIDLQGGKSCLITEDGKFFVGDSIFSFELMKEYRDHPSVSCNSNGTLNTRGFHLQIEEKNHILECSQLHVLGVKMVYVLAMKRSGFVNLVHKYRTMILIFLTLTIVIMIIMISTSFPIIHMIFKGEVYLNSKLMKQVVETEQAERKSSNKRHAFSTASHDIRTSLTGMMGLIEISYYASGSDLEANLRQLKGCTKDLSSMLTSILDASKLEAGKMLLEEEEFDVFQLFEDVVDLYHPVGVRKGVDVIFDTCDGSISKFSRIKSDRLKIRRILTNLISNAVKFTFDGEVIVRAWIGKQPMKSTMIESNQCSDGLIWSLAGIFFNKRDNESSKIIMEGQDYMELVCEVDDTGKGIPKDKRKEVFENFVQVNETARGQVGTGLGLGIVQSLVRLMHGEIGIMEKYVGEKGSCFRFNIPITISDNVDATSKEDFNNDRNLMPCPQSGARVLIPSPSKLEGSCVVLLIQNNKRRELAEKFMESLGIRAFQLKSPVELPLTLERMLGFVLLVVDANAGKFSELCETTREFRKSLLKSVNCRVVWLENHEPQSDRFKSSIVGVSMFAPDDVIVKRKPLHGSRLFEVARLLPEFGGTLPDREMNDQSRAKAGQSGKEQAVCPSKEIPLLGKKFLVVDDTLLQRKIAKLTIERLGATVELCKNGLEAFELVCKGLTNLSIKQGQGDPMITALPYDYILMDCEMPVMDGYDATGEIRKKEILYGIHIPIIALTAHMPDSEEARRTVSAGMDAFLSRPLKANNLIDVINGIGA